MAIVTVWQFDLVGQPLEHPGLRRCATQGAIDRYGYVRRDGTELEVDDSLLDLHGLTREEYLTFRVGIKHSEAFAGFNVRNQRLNVMSGEYDARRTLREFNPVIGGVSCVQLVSADTRGGDLWIKIDEYDELENFPYVDIPLRLEILDWRVTEAAEL